MKVLYEPDVFSIQDFGGVSRYFHELIDHAGPDLTCELPVVLSNNLYLRDRKHTQHRQFFPGLPIPGAWRVIQCTNRRAARRAIERQDFDVFHPTMNDSAYFLDLLGHKPLVLTIHDMIPSLFGEYYGPDNSTLELLAKRAAHIITVSEHTRADVLRLLPVAAERVSVVHHGHRMRSHWPAALPQCPDHYLLFIGKRTAYKNFGALVTALGLLVRREAPGLHLVCAGGGAFTPAELLLLAQAGVTDRVHQFNYLTDGQLDRLYRGARAFVFPSRYEGFGLPILEAFGQQCPVVLSRASCFPEIAQDAALYFDPQDAEDLHAQLARLLHDPQLRQCLTRRGQVRRRDFTWERTVAGTCRAYEAARETSSFMAHQPHRVHSNPCTSLPRMVPFETSAAAQ